MITSARKKSADPAQEALREEKSVWNKRVSILIDNMINLKKMMNGHPSKFHMEKSDIKEPLPENPATILEALVGEFNQIAQSGNQIISDQIEYSEKRKKKQPKQQSPSEVLPTPEVVETPNLTEQLSVQSPLQIATSSKYEHIVLGSGRLSRFHSRLQGPWFGSGVDAIERRNRLSLLDSTKDLYDMFSDFQTEILSTKESTINSSNKLLIKIEDHLKALSNSVVSFIPKEFFDKLTKSDKPDVDKPIVDKPVTDKPVVDKSLNIDLVKKIMNDWIRNSASLTEELPNLSVPKMMKLIEAFDVEGNSDKITELNTEALIFLSSIYNKPISSLEEVVQRKASPSEKIQILAEINIKKWIRRMRQQHLPFAGKTSASRLATFEAAEEMRTKLDHMMDDLEISIDPKSLISSIESLWKQFVTVEEAMSPLIPGSKYQSPSSIFSKEHQEEMDKKVKNKEMRDMVRRLTDTSVKR